jgi:hypothetical protein
MCFINKLQILLEQIFWEITWKNNMFWTHEFRWFLAIFKTKQFNQKLKYNVEGRF